MKQGPETNTRAVEGDETSRSLEEHRQRLEEQTLPRLPAGPPQDVEDRMMASRKRRRNAKVRELYSLGTIIGSGGFAVVKVAKEKRTGEQWACKVIKLPGKTDQLSPEEVTREEVFKEIEIVSQANHRNVVCMKEFFVAQKKVYLLMEFMRGGMLLDALLKREAQHYTEEDAKTIFKQLLDGLDYLHERNVTHRDLKLENLMLVNKDDITHMKIVDFGLAKHTLGYMNTVCGTPQYVAPEVLERSTKEYGKTVDMWSSGVILYILLAGYPPFYHEHEAQMYQKIRDGDFNFAESLWNDVSKSAKDLVCKLLQVDPQKRLTVKGAKEHNWFFTDVSGMRLENARANMAKVRKADLFRKAVHVVKALNRMKLIQTSDNIQMVANAWKNVPKELLEESDDDRENSIVLE